MEEFARLVGVSRATVSRAINGHPRVAPETKETIFAAMEQYNFWPNGLARGLVTRHTGMIGMVTCGLVTPYHSAVIQAIEDELFERNYNVIFAFSSDSVERERNYLRMLEERQVDGILVSLIRNSEGELENAGLVQRLHAEGTRVVLIDTYLSNPQIDCVNGDLYGAAKRAIEYLTGLGHKRIGYLCPDLYRRASDGRLFGGDRLEGYRRGLEDAGINFDETIVLNAEHSIDGGYLAAKKLLEVTPRPTAIFCYTDILALGALRAVRDAGLAVPSDISIMGCDDSDLAARAEVPLTTLRLAKEELGRLAARMLVEKTKSGDAEDETACQIALPAELVVRESTAGISLATK
jgi:DNA-binding LacI/PurR family transcriptional regulator